MASKSSSVKRNDWEVDFVNVNLSKDQKEQLFKWDVKGEATFDVISRLIDDQFKLSISSDKAHDCVGAFLTTPNPSDGSRKRCLGARGPDFFGALRALAFKHSIVLEGDWGELDNNSSPVDRWG